MKMGKKAPSGKILYFGCDECKFNLTTEYSLHSQSNKNKAKSFYSIPLLFS